LILAILGVCVPWRGAIRVRALLQRPRLSSADRLALYASTIAFQWILFAFVGWRCYVRGITSAELGFEIDSPVGTAIMTIVLTSVLCATQCASLRAIRRLPIEQRGSVFAVTDRLMPRSLAELLAFAALVCTAGLSEEFLYRGFVFEAFRRLLTNT